MKMVELSKLWLLQKVPTYQTEIL